MKIKVADLKKYLDEQGITKEQFAMVLNVASSEVDKLLNGEAVGINTARKFIGELGADVAQRMIDWDAIGGKNPIEDTAA